MNPFTSHGNRQEDAMFNIGAVSRMTNILEATLRVWERRYDFPKASRTSGGHRLYSQQDVVRLQWVKARIDEGMQVSRAIQALQQAEDESAFGPIERPSAESAHLIAEGISLEIYQKRLFGALKAHDLDEANVVISELQVLYPLEEIILGVFGPTLQGIGEAWEHGEVDVASEHLATNFLLHFLLTWMRVGPPAYSTSPVMLACAPGELHEGSVLMLGVLLRRLRWPILYLGQMMPLANLSIFVEELTPALMVFVAMTEGTAQALKEWPERLPEVVVKNHPVVCFGGKAFVEHPELVDEVRGVYLGETLQEAVQKINAMLHRLNPLLQ